MDPFRYIVVPVTQAPSLAQSASFFRPAPGQPVLSISTVPTTYSMNFGSYAAGDVLYGGGELMTCLVGWGRRIGPIESISVRVTGRDAEPGRARVMGGAAPDEEEDFMAVSSAHLDYGKRVPAEEKHPNRFIVNVGEGDIIIRVRVDGSYLDIRVAPGLDFVK